MWLDIFNYCMCYISYFLYLPESINTNFYCVNVLRMLM